MSSFSSSKTAIKDSFEDDEGSDDVEDEVFIRDGRNGYKIDDEVGVKRPLMAPRRKCKPFYNIKNNGSQKERCSRICYPYCFIPLCIIIVICVTLVTVNTITNLPIPLEKLRFWSTGPNISRKVIVPCTEFSHQNIWVQSFPKLKSEVSLTLAKLNSDEIEDIILGYSTGDREVVPCLEGGCGGGAIALDGKSGSILWQHWTRRDVLFVDCSANVNNEPTHDCLLSGKGGVVCMVDGKSGKLEWEVSKTVVSDTIDVYSAQFVHDVDSDGTPDVLISHTSDSTGFLMIMSGRSGQVLGKMETPDKKSLFTVPRLTVTEDGTYCVVFATGSHDSPGSLYSVPIYSIAHVGKSKPVKIWSDTLGISSGIVLADMNLDRTEDLIITSGNRLTVINGRNFTTLWNTTLSATSPSQILIGPTPAYFDSDKIPDLLITILVGPTFPVYYYAETQVLSGKDGSKLLGDPIISAGDITAPGVSVSYTGSGNDMYLYWLTTCNQKNEQQTKPFSFPQGLSIDVQAHADLCRLRFNSSLEARLHLLSEHIRPPGFVVYSSDKHWYDEHKLLNKIDTSTQAATVQTNVRQEALEPLPGYIFPNSEVEEPIYPQKESVSNQQWGEPDYLDNRLPETNMGELALDFDLPSESQNVPEAHDQSFGYDRDEKLNLNKRKKRETSRSDLPRATATPTLAKPLNKKGIDVIFATHWVTSSNAQIVTDFHEECIRKKTSEQPEGLNRYELEIMRRQAERECIGEEEAAQTQSELGQLTIYRVNIQSSCYDLKSPPEECSQPLESSQSYPRRTTSVYFVPRGDV